MKKIASFILLAALFYNVLGLYIMFADQQEQAWVNAMQQTSELNFEVIESDINAYSYVVDSGFEDANEDIVVNNKSYHVFKKRIQNNTLKFYCLRNFSNKIFNIDLKKIVDEQLFDKDSNRENPTKKLAKSILKDFVPNYTEDFPITPILFFPDPLSSFYPKSMWLSHCCMVNYPPPDMV